MLCSRSRVDRRRASSYGCMIHISSDINTFLLTRYTSKISTVIDLKRDRITPVPSFLRTSITRHRMKSSLMSFVKSFKPSLMLFQRIFLESCTINQRYKVTQFCELKFAGIVASTSISTYATPPKVNVDK